MKPLISVIIIYLISLSVFSSINSRKIEKAKKIEAHQPEQVTEQAFTKFLIKFQIGFLTYFQGFVDYAMRLVTLKKGKINSESQCDLADLRSKTNNLMNHFSSFSILKDKIASPYLDQNNQVNGNKDICLDIFIERHERTKKKEECVQHVIDEKKIENPTMGQPISILESLKKVSRELSDKGTKLNDSYSGWSQVVRHWFGNNYYKEYTSQIKMVQSINKDILGAFTQSLDNCFEIKEYLIQNFHFNKDENLVQIIQNGLEKIDFSDALEAFSYLYFSMQSKGGDIGEYLGRFFAILIEVAKYPTSEAKDHLDSFTRNIHSQ